jgi:hypothetical protein
MIKTKAVNKSHFRLVYVRFNKFNARHNFQHFKATFFIVMLFFIHFYNEKVLG